MGYLLFQLVKLSEKEDYYIERSDINEAQSQGSAILKDNEENYVIVQYSKENDSWEVKEVFNYV